MAPFASLRVTRARAQAQARARRPAPCPPPRGAPRCRTRSIASADGGARVAWCAEPASFSAAAPGVRTHSRCRPVLPEIVVRLDSGAGLAPDLLLDSRQPRL